MIKIITPCLDWPRRHGQRRHCRKLWFLDPSKCPGFGGDCNITSWASWWRRGGNMWRSIWSKKYVPVWQGKTWEKLRCFMIEYEPVTHSYFSLTQAVISNVVFMVYLASSWPNKHHIVLSHLTFSAGSIAGRCWPASARHRAGTECLMGW